MPFIKPLEGRFLEAQFSSNSECKKLSGDESNEPFKKLLKPIRL
jgi:hypothetical protein